MEEILSFIIKGKLRWQILDWERSIDEKVFNEQLATGLLCLGPGELELEPQRLEEMLKLKNSGVISPYYGTFNCAGAASTFSFCFSSKKCDLIVTHIRGDTIEFLNMPAVKAHSFKTHCKITSYLTGKTLRFTSPLSENYIRKQIKPLKQEAFASYDFLFPLLTRKFYFIMEGDGGASLKDWQHWMAKDALTTKYIYKFSEGSCFTGKYVVDRLTNDEMDLTDYEGI